MLGSTPAERLERALVSLEGLSVGDAFGDRFFVNDAMVNGLIAERALPAPPWRFSDDTMMALSVVAVLSQCHQIDQDLLARDFAARYDPSRGYGPSMHGVLRTIQAGAPWREIVRATHDGQGSWGNGAAMRVAPLGAYFADDLLTSVTQAALSAEATHTHPEGVAGAIAVAVASTLACRLGSRAQHPSVPDFLWEVEQFVPDSEVRLRLRRAIDLPQETTVAQAGEMLGNGSMVSAQDTVPFAVWCAATYLERYEDAMWATVSALGDRDTTCAIVGGIVAAYTGSQGIPSDWRAAREPLPDWFTAALA